MKLALIALLALAPLGLQSQSPAPIKHPYLETSAVTRTIAEGYFRAYLAKDWDALASLSGANLSFQDRTAELVGGGKATLGLPEVLRKFREGYASIELDYHPARATFSGHYALFSGILNWKVTLQNGRRVETRDAAFLVILRVEDGEVVEHRDYVDYNGFIQGSKVNPQKP